MKTKKRSCYKCTLRRVGCQAVCPRFKEDDEALQAQKMEERKDAMVLEVLANRYIPAKDKYSKTSGKRLKLSDFR